MTKSTSVAILLDKMNSYRSKNSTRPDSGSAEVRTAALMEHIDTLRGWAVVSGNCTQQFADDVAFANLLSLAVLESGDAYEAVKWLDDNANWDVETKLVDLLDRVYTSVDLIAVLREREWVVATGARFPATVGQAVNIMIGDEQFLGGVVHVERPMARATVNIGTVGNSSTLRVNSEDVVEVLA